uniref:Calpain-A-like n=1 Tax=Phallusia mammillata TaxID=59560 RepID=A0A6F9D7K0_9ASCI|nr:calpain-A-like [Phallusia mammillata]
MQRETHPFEFLNLVAHICTKFKMELLFEDISFPPNSNSLLFKKDSSQFVEPSKIIWKRPHEIAKNPSLFGISIASEPTQGILGNCWMVAPLYSLQKKMELLKRLFVNFSSFGDPLYCGKCICLLWDETSGSMVEILIDDKLPTIDGKLIMGACKHSSEFWWPLLEKACAKLYGCYEALTSGLASEGFMLFTAGYCWRKELSLKNSAQFTETKQQIVKSLDGSLYVHLFVCFSAPICSSITKGHYYVIIGWKNEQEMDVVQLWNPWNFESASNLTLLFNSEFCESKPTITFTTSSLCVLADKLVPWFKHEVCGVWHAGKTSGGNRALISFDKNPQYLITMKQHIPGKLYICLIQTGKRQFAKRKNLQQALGLHVWNFESKSKRRLSCHFFNTNPAEYSLSPSYQYMGDVHLFSSYKSNVGSALIVPSTFEANISGTFLLRVCSSSETTFMKL